MLLVSKTGACTARVTCHARPDMPDALKHSKCHLHDSTVQIATQSYMQGEPFTGQLRWRVTQEVLHAEKGPRTGGRRAPTSWRAGVTGIGVRRGVAGRTGPHRTARGRRQPADHRSQGPSHCRGLTKVLPCVQGVLILAQVAFYRRNYVVSADRCWQQAIGPETRHRFGTLLAVIRLLLASVALVEGRRRSAITRLRADAARPAVSEVCWGIAPIGSHPSVLPSPASRRWRASPLPSTHLPSSSHHPTLSFVALPRLLISGSLKQHQAVQVLPHLPQEPHSHTDEVQHC